ncbi:MAG: GDSL-type esterase/lipase family protein [Actinomycetota bacterium]
MIDGDVPASERRDRVRAAVRVQDPPLSGSRFIPRTLHRLFWVVLSLSAMVLAIEWTSSRILVMVLVAVAAFTIWMLGRSLRAATAEAFTGLVIGTAVAITVLGVALLAVYVVMFDDPTLLASVTFLSGLTFTLVGVAAAEGLLRHLNRNNGPLAIGLVLASVGFLVLGWVMTAVEPESLVGTYAYLGAAIGAYLSMTFGTEPWIGRCRGRLTGWPMIGLGIAVAVGTTFWARRGPLAGAETWVWALAAALAVLVWVIVTDADGVLALALIGAALLWAVVPRTVDREPISLEIAGGPQDRIVVALGDSFLSGEGADRYEVGTNVAGSNTCRRSSVTHVDLLQTTDTLTPAPTVITIACSGSVIDDVIDTNPGRASSSGDPIDWPDVAPGTEQMDQLQWIVDTVGVARLDAVVIGVGGNDAGFSDIGRACVGAGDCSEILDVWRVNLATVAFELQLVLQEAVAVVGPDVPVVASPYPSALTAEGCWWTFFSAAEHAALVQFIDELNLAVETAAAEAGVLYLEPIPGSFSAGENDLRVCGAGFGEAGLNLVELNPQEGSVRVLLDPRNWLNNSFHPNPIGHEAMAEAAAPWWGQLAAGELASPAPNTAVPEPDAPCGSSAECDEFVAGWALRQLNQSVRTLTVPVLLITVGSWLAIVGLVRRWRWRMA